MAPTPKSRGRCNVSTDSHFTERATGLEPATSSLGSWHSTTELRPQSSPVNVTGRPPSVKHKSISPTSPARLRDLEALRGSCAAGYFVHLFD